MLTSLTLQRDRKRVLRDPTIALTQVTFFCGPNGSGKSTVLDALRDLIQGDYRDRESAPVLPVGGANTIHVVSFEKDNLRVLSGANVESFLVAQSMILRERSHGQSNFGMLQRFMDDPALEVLVLDEPESALDLDGILWLRQALETTTKQVIIATHSILLLTMPKSDRVSTQIFGKEAAYLERVTSAYSLALGNGKAAKARKRLTLPRN
jgi:predicted ATPase